MIIIIIILVGTNPHVIVQPVHVGRTFHRMQGNGTMDFFPLEISGERLRPAAVVIKNGLHLRYHCERIVMSVAESENGRFGRLTTLPEPFYHLYYRV